ncbi:hypothetical protein HWQ46_01765 [Shewanella sp. D64]|uniref:hypothetical protein n=1 Tax=unclassified Shewanella TaxID=196818 RepID=UPI0022BA19E1|nr:MULTISPECIES: hypothetical protein [unclassified Shewanella]MEC4724274.1 hypothetical protein [Shewanella sp. D64]MEC4738786.1 hypothetical protein [Shewanella sp. E94]WBJ97774.1 hypothetical protein HWQ47_12090 [Shewanella sp. MTB7]
MDIISPINNSLTLLKRLKDISENVKEAEFKNLLADLSMEIADAKLAAADLKEQIATLREENLVLKNHKNPVEKPEIKCGCYYFDGDNTRLYCTACFDSKDSKILTTSAFNGYRVCGVCKAASR